MSPCSEAVGNRFQQEELALARLNHPNITHLYAFLPKDDTYWMVMEYVNGNTLEEWLKIHGQMRPAIAGSIIIQILDGLCHAHRKGIIHRDLKPANVMISEEGEVKVMDFGIARIRNSQRITQHGKSVGTLEYMAPEQIQGKEGDERTDIYAAGNILYELLCGQPPFRADTDYHLMKAKLEEAPPVLPALANVTPAPLKSIILKALERKPEKRFETASAFRDALNNCMQHSFLKESSLIAALTNPPSKELSLQNKSGERLSALKMNAATISSGFLNNLSYHSRQVSDQFVRLISGKSTAGNKEIQNDRSRGFLSRTLMRINDNAVAFLLIVVLLCGMLIIWNYFSGTARSNAEEFKTPALSAQEQDSIDKEQSNQKNAYLIETQLSKVPPLTVSESEEGKSEDSKEEIKSKTPPKETAKKKTDTSSNDKVSVVETKEENKPDNETPSETESTPAKREPTGPVTIPAGKPISLVLDENISSEEPERDGEVIRLHSAEDIVVQGRTIIRKGAVATGKIVDVVPSKGRKKAVIGFVINKVEGANGSMLKLDSERFKLIAQSAGSPAVYHIGQQFSAKLGRGKFE